MSEIKFSPTPPTKPGAYWYKNNSECEPTLAYIRVFDGVHTLVSFLRSEYLTELFRLSGLWSSRLVPVDEVEKAWHEGFDVLSNGRLKSLIWSESRAKQVVEGEV